MIRGKGARRKSYKCGGQGGDKRIYAMCAPPMGVNVIREHGGDWHQVMCPAGQTVVGGGCDAKKSPYKFEYNGPVIDGGADGRGRRVRREEVAVQVRVQRPRDRRRGRRSWAAGATRRSRRTSSSTTA